MCIMQQSSIQCRFNVHLCNWPHSVLEKVCLWTSLWCCWILLRINFKIVKFLWKIFFEIFKNLKWILNWVLKISDCMKISFKKNWKVWNKFWIFMCFWILKISARIRTRIFFKFFSKKLPRDFSSKIYYDLHELKNLFVHLWPSHNFFYSKHHDPAH